MQKVGTVFASLPYVELKESFWGFYDIAGADLGMQNGALSLSRRLVFANSHGLTGVIGT